MELAHGGFAAESGHDTVCMLEDCLPTLKLLQLKETNSTHGPDS